MTLFRLLAIAGLFVLVACQTTKTQKDSHKSKPNIIYIILDDLGYGDVGFNGQDKIETPRIDQLAKEGIIFTNHYAGAPVCGPSRAVLMTGKHLGHCTVRGNPRWTLSGTPVDIDSSDVTIAEELKRAGYRTGIVGKWGLAENLSQGRPNEQGFDYFYGFNRHLPAHHYYPEQVYRNEELITIEGNITAEKKGQYITDLFTQEAKDFIRREANHSSPFYLHLAYTTPHYELTIPAERKAIYEDKDWPLREMKAGHYLNDKNGHVTYAAMVTGVDRQIGEVLDLLDELNIADNTLVVFTSDNGHEYDKLNDEFFNSNGDGRGRKRDLYEGGIKVPFAAKWPNHIMPGSSSEHVSAFWDFLPTVCDIAGVEPSDKSIDGISFLPSLLGDAEQQQSHDYLYWEFNETKGPVQMLRQGDWKLYLFVAKNRIELYNVASDVSESNNIAKQHPEKCEQLTALLQEARTEHPEFPLTKRPNPYKKKK
ncbi:arylsulfatase [Carboxylicivirga marina]|uniref:arylsulfatase n=1 Tax=Carboxylicivirga marina TaxID=2800988 RepID=UPI00259A8AC2|nr:arylsulfatase [uncultured Carboxylicivirga sp.]